MDKLKSWFLLHKITAILIIVLIFIGVGGVLAFQGLTAKQSGPTEEIDLTFDAEGPFALLFPRRDGNALSLNLKEPVHTTAFLMNWLIPVLLMRK